MKLSIFPEAKPLPTQEEKKPESFKTSKPYKPEVREFRTEDDLIELVTEFAWSPMIFKEYRREDDFISTDILAFDIDKDMTIDEAEDIVKDLEVTCLCLPSTRHSEENHRFRLIFPLSRTITKLGDYKETYAKYAKYFPVDPQCHDGARFYFGCTLEDGFFWEADLLKPVREKTKKASEKHYDSSDIVEVGESIEELVEHLYGEKRKKIPESISYFLENAHTGLSGEMYARGNSFLFVCGLLNLEKDRINDVFYQLYPYEVTRRVRKSVDKIIQEGYDSREEN